MLTVIVSVIFLTGLCACDQHPYHEGASKEYTDLVATGMVGITFGYHNIRAQQEAEISSFTGTGVLFRIKNQQRNGKVFFDTSSGRYILSWFAYDCRDARFHLRFTEISTQRTIVVFSTVFSKPSSAQLLGHANQETFEVQLMDPGKLSSILGRTGAKKIDVPLSIAWIEKFFQKGKPVPRDRNPARGYEVYIARALIMKDEELSKLCRLSGNLDFEDVPLD